jgi:hypothetical protein
MRLTTLVLCCLLIGCSQAASVRPSQPGNTATATQPHVIGGWTQYSLPIQADVDLAVGHDGNLYAYSYNGGAWNQLVKIDPAGNETTIPTSGSGCREPESITPNPDGNIYAITGTISTPSVSQVTPQGGVTEYPLPINSCPMAIVTGSDGNLWLVQYDGGVGRMTPGGQYTEFGGGLFRGTVQIARGADKNLWISEVVGVKGPNTLVRVNVNDGSQTTFPAPNEAISLTEGPAGVLYMMGKEIVYRVNMDGTMTPFPLRAAKWGSSVTLGTKGRLFWIDYQLTMFFHATKTDTIERRLAAPTYGMVAVSSDRTHFWVVNPNVAYALTL